MKKNTTKTKLVSGEKMALLWAAKRRDIEATRLECLGLAGRAAIMQTRANEFRQQAAAL